MGAQASYPSPPLCVATATGKQILTFWSKLKNIHKEYIYSTYDIIHMDKKLSNLATIPLLCVLLHRVFRMWPTWDIDKVIKTVTFSVHRSWYIQVLKPWTKFKWVLILWIYNVISTRVFKFCSISSARLFSANKYGLITQFTNFNIPNS